MTTGGPDTSDIFVEDINPDNPRQYRYDNQWRDLQVRKVKIGVKKGDQVEWKELEVEYSHHGPIVAHRKDKAYAMAIPYAEEVGLTDQTYETMTARNLGEMKQALGHLQLMAQNVMVATVQGDIYYVRNGRVPIRAPGTDASRPIRGCYSTNEWRGIHPLSDLVQIENPPQGYMQNCNVTPFGMMKDSPLTPEKYAAHPYLYNATRKSPLHQRALMMTELLDAAHDVTVDAAIGIAFNPQVYHAERWQERLKSAWTKAPEPARQGDAAEVYGLIEKWNRRSDADSEGALAYYAFKKGLDADICRAVEPPSDLGDQELLAGLDKAAKWLNTRLRLAARAVWKVFSRGPRGRGTDVSGGRGFSERCGHGDGAGHRIQQGRQGDGRPQRADLDSDRHHDRSA